jgi:predicted dienelactone hydrolase
MIEARVPRRWRARLAVVTVVAGLLATGVVTTAPAVTATSVTTKAQPPKVAQLGKYAVGMRTETFVDSTRPTENVAPTRTLKTAIYYPAQGAPNGTPIANAPPDAKNAPYPLILFSHGLGARGVAYENVLKAWASAGYVVAAPDYPLSNSDAPGGAQFGRAIADTKNQPADATFVINQVIKLDKQKQGLGGIVDPKRIGASGHSLGGITTYGLAYSRCCTDKRIKAAIPMSGIIGVVDGPEGYFQGTATPLLAVHGNADGTVPYGADMNGFARAKTPKYFLTFLGAGHVTPFLGGDNPSAMALKQSTIDFFNRYLKDDKAALDKLHTDANVPGASSLEEHPESTTTARTPTSTTKKATTPSS